MSNEDFDPCECMFNHHLAMQRLLSFLRQTQGYCTDNECFTVSRLPGPSNTPSDNFFMLFVMLGVMMIIFALRPKSLRRKQPDDMKVPRGGSGSNDDPPTPPTIH
ncbi:small integral membrane protein 14 [Leptopilina boulardi]|uniref:small integral membrane protein 14 n=1 Tax=Leptopilina boulardi TaxID=63433 RepID=UPI0021F66EA7|nr:small integral membrane protein 14 [Leptopilina boulardi]XP_051168578.1 small integral membrane protein 14 [Leptopilina boulardi]